MKLKIQRSELWVRGLEGCQRMGGNHFSGSQESKNSRVWEFVFSAASCEWEEWRVGGGRMGGGSDFSDSQKVGALFQSQGHLHQSPIRCRSRWEGRYKATWKSGNRTPMAQGRSTTIISKIQWTRTIRLSMKIPLSVRSRFRVPINPKSLPLNPKHGHVIRQRCTLARFAESTTETEAMLNDSTYL